PAESPLAPAELRERGAEIARAELGPRPRREDQLGVGALPEQEVAQALLPAGPNQEVDVGRGRAPGDLAQPTGERRARRLRARAAPSGLGEGVAGGVVDGQAEGERAPRRGLRLGA